MKKTIILAIIICAMLVQVPQLYAWEVSVDDYMALAIYKESESTLDSDWKTFYNKTDLKLTDYDDKNIEGELYFGVAVTPQAQESWDISGVEFQTNDMSFWETDTGIDVGWAFSLPMKQEIDITLTPLLGYRWRFIRFTRTNFTILNIITIRETVDEDYNLHFLDLGGKVGIKPYEKVELFAKPILGIVLYNSAHNSTLGTVKGGGGFIFGLDTGLNYSIKENIILGLMFSFEIQRLTGGESGNIIWPDNSLDTYGGKISLSYKF